MRDTAACTTKVKNIYVGRGRVTWYIALALNYLYGGCDKVKLLAGGRRISKALVIGKLLEKRLGLRIEDIKITYTENELIKDGRSKILYFPGVEVLISVEET